MVDNMEWFNVFGLIFIAVIMIPNVVFAIKCKDGFDNKWNNKYVEVTEQVGRLGCFGFMIINIPGTWFGWWSDEAFALYLIVDTILVMLLTLVDSRTNLAKSTVEALRANFGNQIRMYRTQIPIAVKAAETSSKGKSIYAYEPNSTVSKALV